MNTMQLAWARMIMAASSVMACCSIASGAELRTSAGDRPVVRTVSHSNQPAIVMDEMMPADSMIDPFGDGAGNCDCQSCLTGCQSCCLQACGFWADVDFLLGWRHGIRFPPLVTSSPNGTAIAAAGVLGQATTTIVYPTEPVGEEARPGGRISAGAWLDPWKCWGVEGRLFMLADERTRFDVTSNGDPILARPFFDLIGNAPAALLVAFPGIVSPGNVTVDTESTVSGGDALLRRSLCRWNGGRMDLLIGYQFSRIDESLVIANRLTDIDPNNLIPDGTVFVNSDSFVTRNEYHAVTIGAIAQYEQRTWRLDLMGKIGLGTMRETVTVSGFSVTDNPPLGVPDFVTQNGLLAQGANLGTFSDDKFVVSPEINVKLVYHVTECLDVSAGYTFIYWSDVAQPGRQVDPNLRVPADRFALRDSEWWLHALTLGVSCRF